MKRELYAAIGAAIVAVVAIGAIAMGFLCASIATHVWRFAQALFWLPFGKPENRKAVPFK